MFVEVAANVRFVPSSSAATYAAVGVPASAGSPELTSELAAASPYVVGMIALQSVRMPGVSGSRSGANPVSSRRTGERTPHRRGVAVTAHVVLGFHAFADGLGDLR